MSLHLQFLNNRILKMMLVLPLVLVLANLAMSQLFTNGITTDLTPPTSNTFATGFGTSTVLTQGPFSISNNGASRQVVTTGGNSYLGQNSVFGLGSGTGIVGPGSIIRTGSGVFFVSGGTNGGSVFNRQFQQFAAPIFGNGGPNFPDLGEIPRPVLLIINRPNPAIGPRTVSIVRFRRSQ